MNVKKEGTAFPKGDAKIASRAPTEEKPARIQRKRTKGWRMPPNTVYVGRPTKWGNPINRIYSKDPIKNYREHILFTLKYCKYDLAELRGKNLACWCPLDQPCHADVLLELANKEADGVVPIDESGDVPEKSGLNGRFGYRKRRGRREPQQE